MIRRTLLVATISLAACGGFGIKDPGTTDPGDPLAQQKKDEEQYKSVTAQLETKRTQALSKKATEIASMKSQLFWLEFPTFDPTLHRLDDATGVKYNYGFSIGTGNDYNYRASDKLIVTALKNGDKNIFKTYRLDQQAAEIDEITVDGPKDEQKWWAYAADGADVYLVKTNPAELWKWTPGSTGSLHKILDFAAVGVQMGEFWDFAVDSGQMVFIESGRIWKLDLGAGKATWLQNKTEVQGTIWFDKDGILFTTATGPFYYKLATGEPLDVGAAINASTYKLNDTYKTAHLYYQDAALKGSTVYYIGNSGVFAFDLGTKAIRPVLLTPHLDDLRVVYRYPTPLENGALYVVGLESTSGSVGADGPTWRVAP